MIISSEEDTVSLSLYFEIKNSVIYGGDDTVGYAMTNVEVKISSLKNADIMKYAENQKSGIAKMCEVDIKNVKIVSKEVYERETEETEEEEVREKVIRHDFN